MLIVALRAELVTLAATVNEICREPVPPALPAPRVSQAWLLVALHAHDTALAARVNPPLPPNGPNDADEAVSWNVHAAGAGGGGGGAGAGAPGVLTVAVVRRCPIVEVKTFAAETYQSGRPVLAAIRG